VSSKDKEKSVAKIKSSFLTSSKDEKSHHPKEYM
jgi:hypothetical protein